MDQLPPLLILNPRSDEAFVQRAASLAATTSTPGQLQAALREEYPAAVVRERGLSSDIGQVWYVYRDGHWVNAEFDRKEMTDSSQQRGARTRPARHNPRSPEGRPTARGARAREGSARCRGPSLRRARRSG